jgi:hypothetical protein
MAERNTIPDHGTPSSSGNTNPRPEIRIRSLSGMDGIAARHTTQQASALLPTTADIRKAWRSATRARAVAACNECKRARCVRFHSQHRVDIAIRTWILLIQGSDDACRARCSDQRPCPRCVKLGLDNSCGGTSLQPASAGAQASDAINTDTAYPSTDVVAWQARALCPLSLSLLARPSDYITDQPIDSLAACIHCADPFFPPTRTLCFRSLSV